MVADNNPDKFRQFDKAIHDAREQGAEVVLIHHPEVLGDDYSELVMNLNKLADADLMLRLLPRKDRGERTA